MSDEGGSQVEFVSLYTCEITRDSSFRRRVKLTLLEREEKGDRQLVPWSEAGST